MKLLDRKLRGILLLMTELSVDIIQILDLQSWLYYFKLTQQIFIKYLYDRNCLKHWRDRDRQDKDPALKDLRGVGVGGTHTLALVSELKGDRK